MASLSKAFIQQSFILEFFPRAPIKYLSYRVSSSQFLLFSPRFITPGTLHTNYRKHIWKDNQPRRLWVYHMTVSTTRIRPIDIIYIEYYI